MTQVESGAIWSQAQSLATQPVSPEQQTRLQQLLWDARTDGMPGLSILVPPCPYTAGELSDFVAARRRVAYLPPSVATQHNRSCSASCSRR